MIEELDSIVAAGAALRAGRVSAVRLVEEELVRIAKADPALNAFILVTADAALEDARRADVELRNGQVRGPLHGIPYAVKDIIDVAGLATTANSKIVPVPRADRSAGAVTRLDRAGAVLLGKTSLHEFAVGGPTFELPFPPARNFWDPTRHPGGSSSGSATAVAAQMVYAAIGTDTGGSVRNPATSSGIVGLKPTYGLVGRSGIFPLSFSLDHVGPMTRSVEDNALVLSAIAGADYADPSSVDLAPSDYLSGLNRGVSGLSIGLVEHFHEEGGGADPELVEALHEAARMLRAGGARVETCRLPALADFAACGRTIQFAESYAIHRQWLRERPGDYCELSLKKLLPGAFIPAADYVAAQQARRDLCAQYEDALEGFDAIMLLSGFELPARFDQPDEIARTYERHTRMPFNVTGAPALAVPVGWSRQGLPLGIQIAGRPFSEAMLFRVGHALEHAVAQQHQGRRPPPPSYAAMNNDRRQSMLPRERIAYSTPFKRPPLSLPGDGRMIVWSVVNVEEWELSRPMARQVSPAPMGQTSLPDMPHWTWHEYGMRVGFWRLKEALDRRGIVPTFSLNAAVCETCPEPAAAALEAGWEFMAHCYVQMPISQVEDQDKMIRQSVETIERFTGKRPKGWLGPGRSQTLDTPELLVRNGLSWFADWILDDQPLWVKTKNGPIMSLPYSVEINDITIMLSAQHESDAMLKRAVDAFDRLYEESAHSTRVMAIGVHPYVSGAAHRIKYYEQMYDYICSKPGVVHWTGQQIHDWYAEQTRATQSSVVSAAR